MMREDGEGQPITAILGGVPCLRSGLKRIALLGCGAWWRFGGAKCDPTIVLGKALHRPFLSGYLVVVVGECDR